MKTSEREKSDKQSCNLWWQSGGWVIVDGLSLRLNGKMATVCTEPEWSLAEPEFRLKVGRIIYIRIIGVRALRLISRIWKRVWEFTL